MRKANTELFDRFTDTSMLRVDLKHILCALLCIGAVLIQPAFFFAWAEDLPEAGGGRGRVLVADSSGISAEELQPVRSEPFVPEGLARAIIGEDDRVAVPKPEVYPYSTIARIEVTGACGHTWDGTGFMIGRNFLLTAAHCLFCPEHRMGAEKAVFCFGYRNRRNCMLRYEGEWTAFVGTDFASGYDQGAMAEDWCFVRFEENIGEETGWLGFNTPEDGELNSRIYKAVGYRKEELKYALGAAAAYDARLFTCPADTIQGNSGGPYLFEDQYADGIIVAEDRRNQLNIGRRLTPEIWSLMRQEGYQ